MTSKAFAFALAVSACGGPIDELPTTEEEIAGGPSQSNAASSTRRAYLWFSPSHSPDYANVRIEGYVYDPALPKPAGTVTLHSWYNALRKDNFATTSPSWQGAPGQTRPPNYSWVRKEGHP
jgi:hypothetical protein